MGDDNLPGDLDEGNGTFTGPLIRIIGVYSYHRRLFWLPAAVFERRAPAVMRGGSNFTSITRKYNRYLFQPLSHVGSFPESGHLAGEGGGSEPPSASVFMFCSACVNLARRASLSFSRAASSGSIELSKNKV